MVTKSTKDFPKRKKFSQVFKPVQSIDSKSVKMIFKLTASPSFQTIKRWHSRLLDFLKEKKVVYLLVDESFSGSFQDRIRRSLLLDTFLDSKPTRSISTVSQIIIENFFQQSVLRKVKRNLGE